LVGDHEAVTHAERAGAAPKQLDTLRGVVARKTIAEIAASRPSGESIVRRQLRDSIAHARRLATEGGPLPWVTDVPMTSSSKGAAASAHLLKAASRPM